MKLGISDKGLRRIVQTIEGDPFELTVLPIDDLIPTETDQSEMIIDNIAFLFTQERGWYEGIPPISVVDESEDRGYVIVNGHHRWLAAKQAGLDFVPVRLFPDDPTFVAWFLNEGEQE